MVNALYHRDYQDREPVEITIEPDKISILSFSGPNHTISMEAIHEGKLLRSRRYRNRRLGEFLKELNLTEGRSTVIPTIQEELANNGSPAATIETDDARSYFIIDIPCHPDFREQKVIPNDSNAETNPLGDFPKELTERQRIIIKLLREDNLLTSQKISQIISQKDSVTERTIKSDLSKLKAMGIIKREGSRKDGRWIIINDLHS